MNHEPGSSAERSQSLLALHKVLTAYLDMDGLRLLCFDLGVDDEDLPGETRHDKARELVRLLERRGHLDDLVAAGRRLVPEAPWEEALRYGQAPQGRQVLDRISRALRGQPAAQRAYRNRRVILQRVEEFWVRGVLEQSLGGMPAIELELEREGQAAARPWAGIVQTARQERTLPPGTQLADLLEETGGSLLIMGAPGAGKTTALLDLARTALARARRDPTQPMPVVFNLSSWAARRPPLAEWLIQELDARYDIPAKIARPWVEQDELLLLLDGLDEVPAAHREACVRAIHTFRRAHMAPLVLCGRTADVLALDTPLPVGAAVRLRPLTAEQVVAYLANPERAAVREMLASDAALQELARTPLMLAIIVQAYRDRAPEEARTVEAPATVEARRAHVLDTYVRRMFERRGADPRYPREQSVRRLGWLAHTLNVHGQDQFFLEQIQPSWLPGRALRHAYVLGSSLAVGLALGLAVGLGVSLAASASAAAVAGATIGLVRALLTGIQTARAEVRSVERLRWSWAELRARFGANLGYALGLGLLGGLIMGLIFGLRSGLARGMGIGLLCGLLGGLVFTLAGGLSGSEAVETRVRPNQGMRRSAANALRLAPVVGLISGGIGWAVGALVDWPLGGAASGLLGGLVDGWLRFGGEMVLRHAVLRLLLWCNGAAPLDYVRFAEYAVERVLMHRVGGGYLFVHRVLRDRLAERWLEFQTR